MIQIEYKWIHRSFVLQLHVWCAYHQQQKLCGEGPLQL